MQQKLHWHLETKPNDNEYFHDANLLLIDSIKFHLELRGIYPELVNTVPQRDLVSFAQKRFLKQNRFMLQKTCCGNKHQLQIQKIIGKTINEIFLGCALQR